MSGEPVLRAPLQPLVRLHKPRHHAPPTRLPPRPDLACDPRCGATVTRGHRRPAPPTAALQRAPASTPHRASTQPRAIGSAAPRSAFETAPLRTPPSTALRPLSAAARLATTLLAANRQDCLRGAPTSLRTHVPFSARMARDCEATGGSHANWCRRASPRVQPNNKVHRAGATALVEPREHVCAGSGATASSAAPVRSRSPGSHALAHLRGLGKPRPPATTHT
jgi:hypothetical protein